MSFREKSAWISFVLIVIVFGIYFASVNHQLGGQREFSAAYTITIGLILAFVLLEVVLHVAVAIQAPSEALARRDERERLIEMRATSVAFQVLVIGALASSGLMYFTRNAWTLGQHVLLAVAVAELVKFGGQIVYYRRGM